MSSKRVPNMLIMMVGCSGSGKSTYAKKNFANWPYVSRDEIRFSMVAEGEEYFSKERAVYDEFVYEIQSHLDTDTCCVADATHLNTKSRRKLLNRLDLENIRVATVFINTPLNVCLERNELRRGTRSYVPRDQLRRMFASLEPPAEGVEPIDFVFEVKN